MINTCLSAPPLTTEALEKSRAYLCLTPSSSDATKEIIVGAIILTRIEKCLRVAKDRSRDDKTYLPDLVLVDSESGLYCHPEKVPAAMGVSRVFVSTSFRRKGIAAALLRAGARTFIHGCPLRFEDGTVAFSQPTDSGRKFMESFGSGCIGIYEE